MQEFSRVFAISYTTFMGLLPYVIAGVILSELLKFVKWANILKEAPKRAPVLSIVLAVLLGIVSPLCTYGTIPIVVTLFRMGFPLQPLITFLVASSVMNPQLFLLTWGGINPEMAIARLLLSFIFSLLFGLAILKVRPEWIVNPNLKSGDNDYHIRKRDFSWKKFIHNSFESLQFIGFYIIIGIVLGAFIEVYVPAEWFFLIFQSRNWLGVLLGALLGVPLYVCGGGTIPLIKSMLMSGMSTGAAIAFFLVGPATRVTPLMALAAIIRPTFIAIYIAVLIVFAVLSGIVYGML